MRWMLLSLLKFSLFSISYGQVQSLKVGDRMPDIYLGKFLDDPSKRLKISGLKGKLVILDFWNINCAVCITGMPKMDSLQKKYDSQLQVIAVTYNNEQQVNALFSKRKFKRPGVPFVIEDKVLNTLFPHEGDPLHVWISPEGLISAITFHYNTNPESVSKFLNGIDPQLSRRWDFGVNTKHPLLSEENSSLLKLATNYSVLYTGLDEYTDAHSIKISDTSIQIINADLLRLYKVAYNNEIYHFNVNNIILKTNNRLIIEAKDKSRFNPPFKESEIASWVKNNTYSYESKVAKDCFDKKFDFMRQDLDRYLPFNASIEKRKTKCLVLTSTIPGELLKTKFSSSTPLLVLKSDNSLEIKNQPVSSLLSQIIYSNVNFPLPIVDGTNYTTNIDICIRSRLNKLAELNEELKTYGLFLQEQEKEIDMLVIRDK